MKEIKVNKFVPVTIKNENGKVIPSGCFSLPASLYEGTEKEAEAFIKGMEAALEWWMFGKYIITEKEK